MHLGDLVASPQAPPGKRWVVDLTINGGCSASGWQYESEFEDFDQSHLPHYRAYTSFVDSTTFVRRRRWLLVAEEILPAQGLLSTERLPPDENASDEDSRVAKVASLVSGEELEHMQGSFREPAAPPSTGRRNSLIRAKGLRPPRRSCRNKCWQPSHRNTQTPQRVF